MGEDLEVRGLRLLMSTSRFIVLTCWSVTMQASSGSRKGSEIVYEPLLITGILIVANQTPAEES